MSTPETWGLELVHGGGVGRGSGRLAAVVVLRSSPYPADSGQSGADGSKSRAPREAWSGTGPGSERSKAGDRSKAGHRREALVRLGRSARGRDGGRPVRQLQVEQDGPNGGWIGEEGDDPHLPSTRRAKQRQHLVDACEQESPEGAGAAGGGALSGSRRPGRRGCPRRREGNCSRGGHAPAGRASRNSGPSSPPSSLRHGPPCRWPRLGP